MCKCVWCQDLEGAENLSTVKGIMGADLFGERERELEDRKERRKKMTGASNLAFTQRRLQREETNPQAEKRFLLRSETSLALFSGTACLY